MNSAVTTGQANVHCTPIIVQMGGQCRVLSCVQFQIPSLTTPYCLKGNALYCGYNPRYCHFQQVIYNSQLIFHV